MKRKYKAVFFDAGGTLFCPYPSVGEIYASMSAPYGAQCDASVLEAEFETAWRRRGGLSSLGSETSDAKELEWWRSLVAEVFASSGGVPKFEEFFKELHQSFVNRELWQIYPETEKTLKTLRQKGMILGVVSNWDLRLPKVIENLGLKAHFDFILGSSAFGATKPSVKIFKEALRIAKVNAAEAIHVGDTYEEDVIGAKQTGITPLFLDRKGTGNSVPQETRIKTLWELCDRV